jgi:protein-tyrosine phosphatase
LDRHIRLDGCANFRDAGGYQITLGGEPDPAQCPPRERPTGVPRQPWIRWRKLFRSDALNELSPADVALLTGDLRITTVVDLRTDDERQRDGSRPLERTGVEIINASLLTQRNAWAMEKPGLTIAERYLWMLELAGEPLVQAITAVARAPGAVIVHCAAGKDRTGLIIAAILGSLGVGDADVVADYALTSENLWGIERRLRRRDDSYGAVPGALVEAPADAMREVLAALRDRHGSISGFLNRAGVGRLVADELAAALVEPH